VSTSASKGSSPFWDAFWSTSRNAGAATAQGYNYGYAAARGGVQPFGGGYGGGSRYSSGGGIDLPDIRLPAFRASTVNMPKIDLTRNLPRVDANAFNIPAVTIGPSQIGGGGGGGSSRLPLYLGAAMVAALGIAMLRKKKPGAGRNAA
jgi:hypothetical protein